ncbi:MAG: DNA alkylation repair protein [Fimbriimonadaceae bacterium]
MEPFKNMYNREFVGRLASELGGVYSQFDSREFVSSVIDEEWESRELKGRMRHISKTMGLYLPSDFEEAIEIVRRAAMGFEGGSFVAMVFPDFVEVYGLEHWEAAMAALEQFTHQSSAEFAIRPFLLRDLERGMAQMLEWAGHESDHVRRLASEGCRPRLPWGMGVPALKRNPGLILPILEMLKGDESEYVRRSVANNLNDIAKDHPELVVSVLGEWKIVGSKEMGKLVRHSLRGLLKQGHPGALELVGHGATECVVEGLRVIDSVVKMGDSVEFEFAVVNLGSAAVDLMVDYVVGFVLARGKSGKKVFKLSKFSLGAGERRSVRKVHSFRLITTRVYYPGVHSVAVQVNGVASGAVEFELVESD